MLSTTQLPGVKSNEPVVKTTPQNAEHRLYAVCRRMDQRLTDLEKRVSTLGTTCNRIERQNYRGAEAKAPPFSVKEPAGDNGGSSADAAMLFG